MMYRIPFVRRQHIVLPKHTGQTTTGDFLGAGVVVIAEPDGGDEVGGETDKPGVAVVLTGAGFGATGAVEPVR